MILRCYGDKLNISLRSTNSTGQTQLDVLRDVIMLFFPCYTPKLVNVTHYNRKLKWTEEFCILLRILSFEMFTWFVKSKDCSGCEYFSPDLCRRMPGQRIESFEVLPSIQRNPEVQVYFVSFRSFEPRNSASILHSVVIKFKIHNVEDKQTKFERSKGDLQFSELCKWSSTQRNLANTWICVVFNSWIRDSVETSCCGHFWICKLAWTLHNWS